MTSSFDRFYSQEGMNPRILLLARRYPSIPVKQLELIMRNKFHPENIVRLVNNKIGRSTGRKTLRLTDDIEVETSEPNALDTECSNMSHLMRCFLVYCQILIELAPGTAMQCKIYTPAPPNSFNLENLLKKFSTSPKCGSCPWGA